MRSTREKEKEAKKPLIKVLETDSDSEKSSSESEAELTASVIKISLEEEEEISTNCPIRGTIMKDPVIASDGHTYEREAITQWQKERGTSPVTREILEDKFKPNYALKKQIENTLLLAEGKKRIEKEKEREKRRHERASKKTEKERRADNKAFKLEMRQFMEDAKEERAAMRREMTVMHERMDKLEEEIEHTHHQNAKLAKEFIEFRDKRVDHMATGMAMMWGLGTAGTATWVGSGIILALVVTGTTVLTGGTIWILFAVLGGAVALGVAVGVGKYFYESGRDELSYARDKPLIDNALRSAANGQVNSLGQIRDAGKFTLTGLVEALAYAITGVGGDISNAIAGWRNRQTLTAPQQVQYLEGVKSTNPTDPAVQLDPAHIKIKYTYDKGQMPLCTPDGSQKLEALNTIAEEGNKKLQEGDVQARTLKASAVYTLATTAVDAGIKAVNENNQPEFGMVYVAAIKIDQAYVEKQTVTDSKEKR